jgi:hypothetical protein
LKRGPAPAPSRLIWIWCGVRRQPPTYSRERGDADENG